LNGIPGSHGDPGGAIELDCAGERLRLLPERAVWWPARQALLVADVHIGKAATFRALGQPVPAGTTEANLQRLQTLLHGLGASHLFVLGDFLHAPQARSPAVLAALAAWRERLAGVECVLVEGNHDRHAGALPGSLGIERVVGPLPLGPFVLSHGDRAAAGGYLLGGHLHPAFVLRGRAGERLRLPCFVFGPGRGILPAFGEFTGSHGIEPGPADRIFVVGDGRVWQVPAAPGVDAG
jgi:DNA ligase-associated metallophosphoesterase